MAGIARDPSTRPLERPWLAIEGRAAESGEQFRSFREPSGTQARRGTLRIFRSTPAYVARRGPGPRSSCAAQFPFGVTSASRRYPFRCQTA